MGLEKILKKIALPVGTALLSAALLSGCVASVNLSMNSRMNYRRAPLACYQPNCNVQIQLQINNPYGYSYGYVPVRGHINVSRRIIPSRNVRLYQGR